MSEDPRQLGPYRLLRKLGEGGQGTVYLGAGDDGEQVAVKVLKTDFEDTGRLKPMLARELNSALSVAAFVTAGVVTFDLDAEKPYIVTEFVDGPTLLEEVNSERGPLRGSRLADLAIQTVIALEAIHGANVVHCDFKPANIILGRGGVKVIDFGIARAWEQLHQAASRVIGSAHFMAPEQVANKPLGPPVDMFAWAATMVFAATGRYAFTGGNPVAVGVAIASAEPSLHGLDGRLGELVRACFHKDPAQRPTAAQVREALMAPAGQPIAPLSPAPPASLSPAPSTVLLDPAPVPAPEAVPAPRRRRGLAPLIFFLTAVLLGGTAVAGYLYRERQQRPRGSSAALNVPLTPSSSSSSSSPSAPPVDPVLQAFAGDRPLAGCRSFGANERTVERLSCPDGNTSVVWIHYLDGEREAERDRLQNNHDKNSPEACRSGNGTGPDGRPGHFIEHTYRDGGSDYAAFWWDDNGSAGLTMRVALDPSLPCGAEPLREKMIGWGYNFEN